MGERLPYTDAMVASLVLVFLTAPSKGHANAVVGTWQPWHITDGDVCVRPPKKFDGKLVFRTNGTFSESIHFGSDWERKAGSYRVRGHVVLLEYPAYLSTGKGKKREMCSERLFLQRGQLWEEGYLTGEGSFVFVPPGKPAVVPRSESKCPSYEDFYPVWWK